MNRLSSKGDSVCLRLFLACLCSLLSISGASGQDALAPTTLFSTRDSATVEAEAPFKRTREINGCVYAFEQVRLEDVAAMTALNNRILSKEPNLLMTEDQMREWIAANPRSLVARNEAGEIVGFIFVAFLSRQDFPSEYAAMTRAHRMGREKECDTMVDFWVVADPIAAGVGKALPLVTEEQADRLNPDIRYIVAYSRPAELEVCMLQDENEGLLRLERKDGTIVMPENEVAKYIEERFLKITSPGRMAMEADRPLSYEEYMRRLPELRRDYPGLDEGMETYGIFTAPRGTEVFLAYARRHATENPNAPPLTVSEFAKRFGRVPAARVLIGMHEGNGATLSHRPFHGRPEDSRSLGFNYPMFYRGDPQAFFAPPSAYKPDSKTRLKWTKGVEAVRKTPRGDRQIRFLSKPHKGFTLMQKARYMGNVYWAKRVKHISQDKMLMWEGLHLFRLGQKNQQGICHARHFLQLKDGSHVILFDPLPPGQTLWKYLNRGRKTIPQGEALDLLLQLVRTVQELQANGLFHWDIAPNNIWITDAGEAILFDFDLSFRSRKEFLARENLVATIGERHVSRARYEAFINPSSLPSGFPSMADEIYALARVLGGMVKGYPTKRIEPRIDAKALLAAVDEDKNIVPALKALLRKSLADGKSQYDDIGSFINDLEACRVAAAAKAQRGKGSPAQMLRAWLKSKGDARGQSYSLQELMREMRQFSETTVRRELKVLMSVGLVKEDKAARPHRYFLSAPLLRAPPAIQDRVCNIPELNLYQIPDGRERAGRRKVEGMLGKALSNEPPVLQTGIPRPGLSAEEVWKSFEWDQFPFSFLQSRRIEIGQKLLHVGPSSVIEPVFAELLMGADVLAIDPSPDSEKLLGREIAESPALKKKEVGTFSFRNWDVQHLEQYIQKGLLAAHSFDHVTMLNVALGNQTDRLLGTGGGLAEWFMTGDVSDNIDWKTLAQGLLLILREEGGSILMTEEEGKSLTREFNRLGIPFISFALDYEMGIPKVEHCLIVLGVNPLDRLSSHARQVYAAELVEEWHRYHSGHPRIMQDIGTNNWLGFQPRQALPRIIAEELSRLVPQDAAAWPEKLRKEAMAIARNHIRPIRVTHHVSKTVVPTAVLRPEMIGSRRVSPESSASAEKYPYPIVQNGRLDASLLNHYLRQIASEIKEVQGYAVEVKASLAGSALYLADGRGEVPLDAVRDLDLPFYYKVLNGRKSQVLDDLIQLKLNVKMEALFGKSIGKLQFHPIYCDEERELYYPPFQSMRDELVHWKDQADDEKNLKRYLCFEYYFGDLVSGSISDRNFHRDLIQRLVRRDSPKTLWQEVLAHPRWDKISRSVLYRAMLEAFGVVGPLNERALRRKYDDFADRSPRARELKAQAYRKIADRGKGSPAAMLTEWLGLQQGSRERAYTVHALMHALRNFSETTVRSELKQLTVLGLIKADKTSRPYRYSLSKKLLRAPPAIQNLVCKIPGLNRGRISPDDIVVIKRLVRRVLAPPKAAPALPMTMIEKPASPEKLMIGSRAFKPIQFLGDGFWLADNRVGKNVVIDTKFAKILPTVDAIPLDRETILKRLVDSDLRHLDMVQAIGKQADYVPQSGLRGYHGSVVRCSNLLYQLKRYAGPLMGKRILDAGFGPGFLLLALRDMGLSADGLEINEDFVKGARAQGLRVHQGNVLTPPAFMLENPYDVTIARKVFDALMADSQADPAANRKLSLQALSQLAKLTKPGGISILEVEETSQLDWGLQDVDFTPAGYDILFGNARQRFVVLRRQGAVAEEIPGTHNVSGIASQTAIKPPEKIGSRRVSPEFPYPIVHNGMLDAGLLHYYVEQVAGQISADAQSVFGVRIKPVLGGSAVYLSDYKGEVPMDIIGDIDIPFVLEILPDKGLTADDISRADLDIELEGIFKHGLEEAFGETLGRHSLNPSCRDMEQDWILYPPVSFLHGELNRPMTDPSKMLKRYLCFEFYFGRLERSDVDRDFYLNILTKFIRKKVAPHKLWQEVVASKRWSMVQAFLKRHANMQPQTFAGRYGKFLKRVFDDFANRSPRARELRMQKQGAMRTLDTRGQLYLEQAA